MCFDYLIYADEMWQDFNAANAVVEATHRYKEIFYDD